jgi:PPOX class probable F420-dependent enzyme
MSARPGRPASRSARSRRFGRVDRNALVQFVRARRLAVLATTSAEGHPQAAVVGIAATDAGDLVLDTTRGSRKFANLCRQPRVALVVGFDRGDEQTVQLEGVASEMPPGDPAVGAYYEQFPARRRRPATACRDRQCASRPRTSWCRPEHGRLAVGLPPARAVPWGCPVVPARPLCVGRSVPRYQHAESGRRIARVGQWKAAVREVLVAHWLASSGVPAVRAPRPVGAAGTRGRATPGSPIRRKVPGKSQLDPANIGSAETGAILGPGLLGGGGGKIGPGA